MTGIDPQLPAIETLQDAEDIGWALHEVLRHSATWAPNVFKGSLSFSFDTGPDVLRSELESMWSDYTTLDERRRIVAAYMARRLSR